MTYHSLSARRKRITFTCTTLSLRSFWGHQRSYYDFSRSSINAFKDHSITVGRIIFRRRWISTRRRMWHRNNHAMHTGKPEMRLAEPRSNCSCKSLSTSDISNAVFLLKVHCTISSGLLISCKLSPFFGLFTHFLVRQKDKDWPGSGGNSKLTGNPQPRWLRLDIPTGLKSK